MGVLIRGGRLVDPASGVDRTADVYIEDGFVAALDEAPPGFDATRTIDATGMVLSLIHISEPTRPY